MEHLEDAARLDGKMNSTFPRFRICATAPSLALSLALSRPFVPTFKVAFSFASVR
jgi:hypothetical protein